MNSQKLQIFRILILMVLVITAVGSAVFNITEVKAQTATVTITVKISICGNGIIEADEQCDGSSLGGQTCQSRGFNSGTLSCTSACEFNTSQCTTGGGGGGGGGVYIPPPVQTVVNFKGRAYPKSQITLLKDAQVAATTIAGSDTNFQISLSGLSTGNYIFSVYSEDTEGRSSSLLTFPISITQGTTTNVSGIFIAPTITTDKTEVKRDEDILISGQSVPDAKIRIFIKSEEKEFPINTIADKDGKYKYNFNTSFLDFGEYQVTANAFVDNISSNLSRIINFIVGTKTVLRKPFPEYPLKGDFNNDYWVNIIDFSILIYWFDRPNPPAEVDLDGNHRVNLIDFSIMAYYWTG